MKYDPRNLAAALVRACEGQQDKEQRVRIRAFAEFLKRKAGARLAFEVLEVLPEVIAKERGTTEVEIESVRELLATEVSSVLQLMGVDKARSEVKTSLNPALLGGFVAKTNDVQLDASLAAKLERVHQVLTAS